MKVSFENLGSETVVKVVGRLDTNSAPDCEREFKPLFEGAYQQVVGDCSKLDDISSSGLRVFLKLQKAFVQLGKESGKKYVLKLSGLNEDIREVFMVTGFFALFTNLNPRKSSTRS